VKRFFGLIVIASAFALMLDGPGWTTPWGHSCNGLQPTAVNTGTFTSGSTDCDFQVTGGAAPFTVTFQETFANLPFCTCNAAAGTQAALLAVPSATATNGGGDVLSITGAAAVTAVTCHCVPR
jgi:hypothetical protein